MIGEILQGLFGDSGADAYKKLQEEIQKGMAVRREQEGSAENILSPYLGDPRLQKMFEEALGREQDPGKFLNNLMGQYTQSDYAKYLTNSTNQAIQHAAASQGLHGSSDELRNIQSNTANIASGDLNQWLAKALGLNTEYLGGLGGLAENESQQQFGARFGIGNWRNELGNNLAGDYGNLGKAEFGEESARERAQNELFGAFGNLGESGLGFFGNPFSKWGGGLTGKFGRGPFG